MARAIPRKPTPGRTAKAKSKGKLKTAKPKVRAVTAKAKAKAVAKPSRAKPARAVSTRAKPSRVTRSRTKPPVAKAAKPSRAKTSVAARSRARIARKAAPSTQSPSEYRAPAPNLPSYRELPVRADAPTGSAWGVFGDDDEVGTINLMTPEVVREAAASIRAGRVFSLNLPITIPDPPLFGRGQHLHTIKHLASNALDDYLDNFYPQASSQWDALCHVKHPSFGAYNGIPDDEITGYGGKRLGIDNLARRGIAGRAVLADVARFYERSGKSIDYMTNATIPLEDVQETLASQRTEIRPGDVLLIRAGWTKAYLAMTPEEKADLAANIRCPGVEGTARMAQWLWDNHFAAAASDTPALEVMPPPGAANIRDVHDLLHFHMLSFFGMPIGEMWNLEELAEDCVRDGRYDCFFTSAPMYVPGGVGSPPNAIAIK